MKAEPTWKELSSLCLLVLLTWTSVAGSGAAHDSVAEKSPTGVLRSAQLDSSTISPIVKIKETLNNISQASKYFDPTTDPESNYSRLSCDFSKDTCGWQNLDGYPLQWERKEDGYVHLNMEAAGKTKRGRLASPWLEPLTDFQCQLRFQYYIQNFKPDNCRISLLYQFYNESSGEVGEERLWYTEDSSGWTAFSSPIYLDVNCTAQRFRMVLEGWKSCKLAWHNEIDVKSIKFSARGEGKELPTETPGLNDTFTIKALYTGQPGTKPPDTTTTTTNTGKNKGIEERENTTGDDTFSIGLLAGIIATAVVAVVVCVIAVFFIIRRHRRRSTRDIDETATRRKVSQSATNASYMLAPGPEPPSGADAVRVETENNYDLVDDADNANAPLAPQLNTIPNDKINGDHEGEGDSAPYNAVISRSQKHAPQTPTDLDTYDHLGSSGASPILKHQQQEKQKEQKQEKRGNTKKKKKKQVSVSVDSNDGVSSSSSNSHPSSRPLMPKAAPAADDDDNDTYDHTSRNTPHDEPVNTYDHVIAGGGGTWIAPPAAVDGEHDYSNQYELKPLNPASVAAAATAESDDAEAIYGNTVLAQAQQQQQQQQQHADSTSKTNRTLENVQRNAGHSNSSAGNSVPTSAPAMIYENVSGTVRSQPPPSLVNDDTYHHLDVGGEKRGEGIGVMVGENVYDHTS